ncbi:ubiquitin-conjugating enzyme E2 [Musa troglodytarum]|uniref:Ubiquitin-conjugating enzyme E2 n=1 Tax=Musa troglodytarum TaxID=320322 RepID=A0A9E7K4D4_9LILI|nr:ubiquitin-conjugating enzyme E2 [Musa troglodytarum]
MCLPQMVAISLNNIHLFVSDLPQTSTRTVPLSLHGQDEAPSLSHHRITGGGTRRRLILPPEASAVASPSKGLKALGFQSDRPVPDGREGMRETPSEGVPRSLQDFVLEGSEGTPFAGGYYYGKLKFQPDYPYKPPSISLITPNGRFATNKKICLSMSDYHPESWNPIWSVSSKNCSNFRKLFPEYVEKHQQQQALVQSISGLQREDDSRPPSTMAEHSAKQGENRKVAHDAHKRRQRKQFPLWLLLLLVSVFGGVMALPLLQV